MLLELGAVGLGVIGVTKVIQNHKAKAAAAASLLGSASAGNAAAIPAASSSGSTSLSPLSPVLTGNASYGQMPDSPTAAQGIINTLDLDSTTPQTASIEGSGQSALTIVAPPGLQITGFSTDTASAFGVINRSNFPAGSISLVPMMGSGTTVNFTATLSDGSTALATVSIT
jgi:hypothetical protein